MRSQNATRSVRLTIIGALFAVAAGTVYRNAGAAAESPHAIPAPAVDEPAGSATSEDAVLAGGCFWGVQGIFLFECRISHIIRVQDQPQRLQPYAQQQLGGVQPTCSTA